jgi:hypothetical protein
MYMQLQAATTWTRMPPGRMSGPGRDAAGGVLYPGGLAPSLADKE